MLNIKYIVLLIMVNYKCKLCGKNFGRKPDYTRHINRKRSCKFDGVNVKQFKCSKCDKSYTTKGSLKRHFSSCKASEKDINISTHKKPQNLTFTPTFFSSKNAPIQDDKDYKCEYCSKKFSRKDSLNRHLKSVCKVKKDLDAKEEIYQALLAKMTNMEEKMNELAKENKELKSQNITINNTTNNNNTNYNNINIQLVAFGKEDKDSMKNSEIFQILRKGFSSVPELVRAIHFNKDRPENHNVYISNMRDNYVMVYDGDKWGLRDRNETIQNIFDDGRNFLVVKYNDMKDKFSDKHRQMVKKFDRFDNDIDHSSYKKGQVFNDIKMILYNNKEMPLKARKLVEAE